MTHSNPFWRIYAFTTLYLMLTVTIILGLLILDEVDERKQPLVRCQVVEIGEAP